MKLGLALIAACVVGWRASYAWYCWKDSTPLPKEED